MSTYRYKCGVSRFFQGRVAGGLVEQKILALSAMIPLTPHISNPFVYCTLGLRSNLSCALFVTLSPQGPVMSMSLSCCAKFLKNILSPFILLGLFLRPLGFFVFPPAINTFFDLGLCVALTLENFFFGCVPRR